MLQDSAPAGREYAPIIDEHLEGGAVSADSQSTATLAHAVTTHSSRVRCLALTAVAAGAVLAVVALMSGPASERQTISPHPKTLSLWWWLDKPPSAPPGESEATAGVVAINSSVKPPQLRSNHSNASNSSDCSNSSNCTSNHSANATLPPPPKHKGHGFMPTFPPIFSYAPNPADQHGIPSQPIPVPVNNVAKNLNKVANDLNADPCAGGKCRFIGTTTPVPDKDKSDKKHKSTTEVVATTTIVYTLATTVTTTPHPVRPVQAAIPASIRAAPATAAAATVAVASTTAPIARSTYHDITSTPVPYTTTPPLPITTTPAATGVLNAAEAAANKIASELKQASKPSQQA